MRQHRFFVPMPACGNQVAVAGDEKVPEDWGIASGWVGGKARLLALSGALETQRTAKGAFAAPMLRPVQRRFAGGGMDGYALLLELGPAPAAPAPAEEPAAPSPAAPPRPPKRTQREPLRWPPKEGQTFKIAPQRFRTVMISFRDPSDRMWPSFVYGGPDTEGSFTFTTRAKPQAAFSLLCREVAQPEGEQQRRVLGQLVRLSLKTTEQGGRTRTEKIMEPVVRFVLADMAPWRLEDSSTLRGETEHVRTRIACNLSGDLTVGDRTIAVRDAPCTATFRVEADREFRSDPTATPNTVDLSLALTVKGKDLGLKAALAEGDVAIRITWTGTDQVTYFTPPKVSDHIPDFDIR